MSAIQKLPLSASQEDYLETILVLEAEHGAAQVRDIAKSLAVAMPSVTGALKGLAGRELVHYSPYRAITLTEKGKAIATAVRNRHRVLKEFLVKVLEVEEMQAADNACRIEHAVDDAVLERLSRWAEFFAADSEVSRRCMEEFHRFIHREGTEDLSRRRGGAEEDAELGKRKDEGWVAWD